MAKKKTKTKRGLDITDVFNVVEPSENVIPEEQIEFYELCRENPVFAAKNLLIRNNKPLQLAPFQRVILKDLWTKQFNMLILSRGAGKCITGDTIIFTEDGMLEISDLSSYTGTEKYLEQKVIKLQGKDNIQETSHWYCDGLQKTRKIVTNFGYNIEGTYEHPVIVMDKNGEIKFKKIGELEAGDYVAIQRGQNYFGNNLKLPEFQYEPQTNSKSYKMPEYITKELARFIGYIIGDGNVTTDATIGFTNIDSDIIDDYLHVTKTVFGDVHFWKSENGQTYYFTSKQIREKLISLGISSTTSHYKKIPKCIMQAPKYIVSNFIRAYFDCDGGVENHCVSISTSSEKLANQLHIVLLNFGIISSLRSRKRNGKIYSYRLTIYGENIVKFNNEIGFGCKRKQKQLNELIKRNFNTNVDIIPYQKDVVKNLIENTSSKNYKIESNIKKLKNIRNSNIFWDKIVSIEESEAVVYDFVVPGDHTFFGNGFINHNTFLLALLCVLRAMLYPREKCVIVSATYRQAQYVFDEVIKFYDESPLFRQACQKAPTKGTNSCEVHMNEGGKIIAYPLGDGTKIRGARANTLVIDETAQVNPDVIDMVVLPFLNTKADPFDKSSRPNYLVYASSAYYQFNHLYERYLIYKDRTNPKSEHYNERYALHQYSYLDMPDGWFDEGIIEEAKAKLTDLQFLMEYGAEFPPDSDGFFPASLMKHCRRSFVIIQKENMNKDEEFVFGIDPARTGDNFALSVIKLGPPNKLVAMYTLNNKTFQEMHHFIRAKIRDYEKRGGRVVRIQMDLGGGGQTLRDMLSEPYAWYNDQTGSWEEMPAILEIDNGDFKYHVGRRILVLQVFNPQTINSMNFDLKNDLEKGNLLLPSQPPSEDPELEQIFDEVEQLVAELQTIVTTPLKSGFLHFDTPKQRMKKDRYTSLLVGAEGARQVQWVDKTPPPAQLPVGFAMPTFLNH